VCVYVCMYDIMIGFEGGYQGIHVCMCVCMYDIMMKVDREFRENIKVYTYVCVCVCIL
jgi:hypothetical protein